MKHLQERSKASWEEILWICTWIIKLKFVKINKIFWSLPIWFRWFQTQWLFILDMDSANESRRYIVMSSLIGCAHAQNDPPSQCPNQWWSSSLLHVHVTGPEWINSLRPNDAYMHQWTNLSYVQIMGCHLFGARGAFQNELLNLRALKFSPVNKMHIFQCMGKIFCVEFQRVPLKFHTKYLTHTLKETIFMQHWNFKSS